MPSLRRLRAVLLASAALVPAVACGQSPPVPREAASAAPPPIARELRAAWVATVGNMDWPSRKGLSSAQQQAEMIAILDRLVQLRMNAVVLQVRPAADALYHSSIEPWSDVVTGEAGRAPEPFYDPLAFATEEAHRRGLEMHVWINPYRAKDPSTRGPLSAGHIARARPELVRPYGPFLWMDPGEPEVRARTTAVVLDIVRRYDIDAVHMDDYFYPYKVRARGRELDFPDGASYARYRRAGGTLARDDWRRENVNLLVRELYDGIHRVKPWVRFGISPFGIWRPGNPPSVRGLDQYRELYADARKWLREGWVDYFAPQLYWPVNRPQQGYAVLLEWWTQQNYKGRHIWAGNYTGKVAFTNAAAWRTDEVLEQIRLTRAQPGASGNVHFSMNVFMRNPDDLNERLVREAYAAPALVPATPWLDARIPARPLVAVRTDSASGDRVLDLHAGAEGTIDTPSGPQQVVRTPWLWAVQSRTDAGWTTVMLPGRTPRHRLGAWATPSPIEVWVTAVDRVGNASPAVRATPPLR